MPVAYARVVVLTALCLGCACGPRSIREEQHVNMADDVARLLQLEKDMFSAIRTRDRQALERVLDESFELRVPGSHTVNRAQFIDAILGIPGTILAVEGEGVEARVYGDVGVLMGRQFARVRLEDGNTVTDVGVFTDVAMKRDGQWRMVLAHSVQVAESLQEGQK